MRVHLWLGVVVVLVGAAFGLRAILASPELVVEGVVKDPAGRPIPGVWIMREGHKDSTGGTPWWRSDSDGRFRIDGVPDGKLRLRFVPGDASSLAGEVVETTGGTRDLAVVIEPGPELVLEIADYAPPEGNPWYARLTWEEPGGRRPVRYTPIRDDGWMRFVRLPEGRDLEVWALAGKGRVLRKGGLKTGTEEVVLTAVPGLEIRGKILIQPGESFNRIDMRAEPYRGFDVGGHRIEDDGTFVLSNLPEGTYRVSAWFAFGAVSTPVVQDLRTGTTDAVFDLRPPER